MSNGIFVGILAGAGLAYLWWGVRYLPGERWQVAATLPVARESGGEWLGVNLTWYGILTANAYAASAALVLILLAAVGLPPRFVALLVAVLLLLCVPASRLVAWLVERKPATFTVGGAAFVGILAAPWVALATSRLSAVLSGREMPPLAILAACAIGYAAGEGLGRLACISFGCCYGRPLASLPSSLARLLAPLSPVFHGPTKKAAYAAGLEGVALVPVQALTALVLGLAALAGIALFLQGHHAAAFLLNLTVSQLWRVGSEFVRTDHRGGGRLSAYQLMGCLGVLYGWGAAFSLGTAATAVPHLPSGLAALWAPAPLLTLQALWLVILLYTGLSRVTGARLRFHLHRENI